MSALLSGTGVALVTPFRKDHSVDLPALKKLVEFVSDNGVDFLVALGTTAETPVLTEEEKQQILDTIIASNTKDLPVVCGLGGNNTAAIVNQLKTRNFKGVTALLSVSPYYNKPSQEGLYRHFAAVAQASPLPIILYNVPGRTGSNMLPATVKRLANDFSNIIGIKDAAGNLSQSMEMMHNKSENFFVFSGDDNLIVSQIAIGMTGIISVAANSFPKHFTDMVNNLMVGRYEPARRAFYKLLTGINLLFEEGNPAGVKCALAHAGICENILRLPLAEVSAATDMKIQQVVNELKEFR
jgi:4-hydroxy-tetrahydrodipicolinate synthase